MRHPWPQRLAAAVLGTLVLLLALEVGLRAIALGFETQQRSFDPEGLRAEGDLTVLCIGESTTAMGGPDSWPAQLQGILGERLPERHVQVVNRGVPGVDSSVLMAQLDANLERYQPAVVAAMMGANDTWTGAIPWEETPMAERREPVLKTWKLARQLLHEIHVRRPPEAGSGPLEARRWVQVDGPFAEPQSDAGLLDRFTLARARAIAGRGDLDQAAAVLGAALARRPGSARLHEEHGVVLRATGRLDEAEASLRQAHALDPRSPSVLVELAAVANDRATQRTDPTSVEWLAQAEGLLRQAIALDSARLEATRRLARLLGQRDEVPEAIALLEGVGDRRSDDGIDALLVDLYRRAGRREEAATLLRRVLDDAEDPCDPGRAELVAILFGLGRAAEGKAAAEELESACAEDPAALLGLAQALRTAGEAAWADRIQARRDALVRGTYCPLTHRSYERLAALLGERGVLLVAVQYPRRPLAALERYVEPQPGVVLVDDEQPFEEAVAQEGYDAIFVDRCYGDFGHATPRGNRLLAERVASAIAGAIPTP